jgi:hypothetical protein
VRGKILWCEDKVSNGRMKGKVVLSKRIPVGRGRQVNRLTDKLASNKWPTGHLEREMAGDNE